MLDKPFWPAEMRRALDAALPVRERSRGAYAPRRSE